jgi:hypothetical protein
MAKMAIMVMAGNENRKIMAKQAENMNEIMAISA